MGAVGTSTASGLAWSTEESVCCGVQQHVIVIDGVKLRHGFHYWNGPVVELFGAST